MTAKFDYPGYSITEELYVGIRTLVYRGVRNLDGQPAILKMLRNEFPSFNELVQFRNQYTVAKNLDIPGIIQPYSLEPYRNSYALVMEDFGGMSLRHFTKGRSLTLKEFFAIALQITDILHHLHQQRIIHKDIKPANILIHPDTQQVKLIDLSIASLLPRETQEIQNPNVLEGTLAYLSPEQTGRMNRGIDFRSDFYSLGVTFFELLTGQLPFVCDDAMELLHCHIAKQPNLAHEINPEIPYIISKIVSKLMAKNAEERYQSALGLKFDLENCLQQRKETGIVESFEIGQRDVSDRFLIPDKLYGRETEVQTLLKAFDRVANGSSELMLVAGFSGIGKTAVVNEVHKPITRQRGYFIKGKFDQFNRNIPFSAFVQAFRSLMGQLLGESDAELANWKNKILAAVGENGQVLIEVIPELERIIGSQPSVSELSGSASQNRFNLLFSKFIQVFTTKEHPLVIFLDDLQWADSASLNLLKLLMSESEAGYLLILGAYRDNEVFPAHPLMLILKELQKRDANLNTLTLAPLDETDITCLVADTLQCSTNIAAPLSQLIYQKTQGNPFFTTQFLQGLHEEECIVFNGEAGYWQCDLTQVRQLALTDDVVKFMVRRLRKLPEATQEVLKLAACIGNRFDLETLAVVCEESQDSVAADLWRSLQEGLVIPDSEAYKFFLGDNLEVEVASKIAVSYRFLHDRVQQAAYELIPQDRRQIYHLKIGESFLRNLHSDEAATRVLEIVEHFNASISLITILEQKNQVIQLNLAAADKAIKSTAYSAAVNYLDRGISLLAENSWEQERELTFRLYNSAAETAFLAGEFEIALEKISIIKQQSHNVLERIKAHEIEILLFQAQYNQLQSLNVALSVLHQLHVEMPEYPTLEDIQREIADVNAAMGTRSIFEIGDLPPANNPEIKAAMGIMALIVAPTYQVRPLLFQFNAIRQFNLSVQYGVTTQTPVACELYGMVLVGNLTDVEQGYQLGQLGVDLLKLPGTEPVRTITQHLFNNHIRCYKDLARLSLEPARLNGVTGMESGDFEYAGYSLAISLNTAYFAGVELETLSNDLDLYSKLLERAKQEIPLNFTRITQQAIANLQGDSTNTDLVGRFYDESLKLPEFYEKEDEGTIAFILVYKLSLACTFGDFRKGLEWVEEAGKFINSLSGQILIPTFYFYRCLMELHGTQTIDVPKRALNGIALERFQNSLDALKEFALYGPANCQHKVDLVEAEYHSFLGHQLQAIELYDKAIFGAKANEYIQEEALANELAAKFYLDWGKEKVAAGYIQEAYYCYARWGAKAKVADLEKCYPQLLAPILQQTRSPFSTNETLFTLRTATSTSSSTYSSDVSVALDLAAILKASQIISGEIELEKLLSSLLSIVIENAGADKCVLMLLRDDRLLIKGSITVGTEPVVLQRLLVEESQDIPLKLIYKVKHNKQTAVLINASADLTLDNDPYIIRQQPKSILCSPILHQGKLIGILYLENNLATGAFTKDRVELLNLLCAQAAISLENARLYERSQNYAQQLEQSLNELNTTQSRFYNLVDNVPGVVYQFRIAADGTMTMPYISASCYNLYEVTAEQAMANVQAIVERVHSEDAAHHQQSIAESMQTLKPWRWEGRIVTLSGIIKWIHGEAHIVQQADGSLVWDGVLLDISEQQAALHERKRAEAALQISEQNLRTIFNNVTNAIIVHDLDGMVLDVNDSTLKLFGLESEQVTQISVLKDCSAPDNPFHLAPDFWRRTVAGEIVNFEWKCKNLTDGRVFDADITLTNIVLGGKAVILGNVQDISDRKRAEQELQNVQLQMVQSEKMSALGNLVAGVAHEMNNPLGFIAASLKQAKPTFADIIEHLKLYQSSLPNATDEIKDHAEEIDLDYSLEDLLKMIDSMSMACDRLKNISTSLRTFSRADRDYKVPFDIHQGIDSTILILKHRLKANEYRPAIEIVTNYGNLPQVECFPGQLNQVFMNLLANAIDALDESNHRSSFEEIKANPNCITITTFVSDNQAKIAIADNGIGMSESVKHKIFDHSFTTKGVGKGTGLGLAIAQQIVEQTHSGQLSCNSILGEGTEFLIAIPL